MSDGWWTWVFHVQLSTRQMDVISFQIHRPQYSVLHRRHRHDMDVACVHHELLRHLCLLLFQERSESTKLAGKFTRVSPVAVVVVDSAGSTSAVPSRNLCVGFSSRVTSEFTIGSRLVRLDPCSKNRTRAPLEPVAMLIRTRAHTCSQQVSSIGSVFGRCVTKHQTRESPSQRHLTASPPSVSNICEWPCRWFYVCRRFQSEHQVVSQSQTRCCSR